MEMIRTCPIGKNKYWLMGLVPIIMAAMVVFMIGAGNLLVAETAPEDTYYFTFVYELQMSGRATRDCLHLQLALSIISFVVCTLPYIAEAKESTPLMMTWYILSCMGTGFWVCCFVGMFFSPSDTRDWLIMSGMVLLTSLTSLVTWFRYNEMVDEKYARYGSALSVRTKPAKH